MFGFIKKCIEKMYKKCVTMNNQECKIRTKIKDTTITSLYFILIVLK